MEKVFVRNPYNYNRDEVSEETGLFCDDDSRTEQQYRDESDINTIVRNFGLTGQLPNNVMAPQYGDFEGVLDYQTALNAVIAAQASFMELPANVRARFHNDPQALLEFCANPDNKDEARKLGLLFEKPSSSTDTDVAPPSSGQGSPVE